MLCHKNDSNGQRCDPGDMCVVAKHVGQISFCHMTVRAGDLLLCVGFNPQTGSTMFLSSEGIISFYAGHATIVLKGRRQSDEGHAS